LKFFCRDQADARSSVHVGRKLEGADISREKKKNRADNEGKVGRPFAMRRSHRNRPSREHEKGLSSFIYKDASTTKRRKKSGE